MNFTHFSFKNVSLTLIIILLSLNQLNAQEITIKPKTLVVKNIIDQIQKQTPFRFIYSTPYTGVERSVTLNQSNVNLEKLLLEISHKAKLKFERSGNQIVVTDTEMGAVSGKVMTSDNKPAQYVTVVLKGHQDVLTDEKGNYKFADVPVGSYSLSVKYVGHNSDNKRVVVNANQNEELDFIVSASSTDLQEVMVSGTKRNKFANKESENVARMPLKNLENPQVYSIISKELLEQQIVLDYNESLRNAPGVTSSITSAGSQQIFMRGFSTGAGIRNGLATQTWTLIDPVNIERTEIIKGPSGTLFGSGSISFGGLANRVTKKPFDTFKGEISYSNGSWDMNRVTLDLNTPVNEDKTALFRVNAASLSSNSFQNFGYTKSYNVSPSFSYQVNEKLDLNFDAEFYNATRTQQPSNRVTSGVSFRNFKAMDYSYNKSFFGGNLDVNQASTNIYAQANYKMSKGWTSSTNFTYSQNREMHNYQLFLTWQKDTVVNRAFRKSDPRNFSTINFQQNFNGDFSVLNLRNRVLLGVDLTYKTDDRMQTSNINYDVVNPTKSFAPVLKEKIEAVMANSTYNSSRSTVATYGAYASDVVDLTANLNLMMSLRVDRFQNNESISNGKQAGNAYNQTALSPKLGLVYQVVKDQVSVFSNYMNGFVNLGPVSQPDGSSLVLKPQQANQWEAGVKTDLLSHRLSTTISWYDIRVKNATRTNENQFLVQDATQYSRGFEAEVVGNVFEGFNIVAGYGYNKNTYTKSDALTEGKTSISAPKNVANLWLSYKFNHNALKNFGIGAGGNYVSDSFYDSANLFTLPAYTLINATVFYDVAKWRIGLKVNNISGQHYYNFYGYPQNPRQLIGNITFKF